MTEGERRFEVNLPRARAKSLTGSANFCNFRAGSQRLPSHLQNTQVSSDSLLLFLRHFESQEGRACGVGGLTSEPPGFFLIEVGKASVQSSIYSTVLYSTVLYRTVHGTVLVPYVNDLYHYSATWGE